jgi:hypothetical protein
MKKFFSAVLGFASLLFFLLACLCALGCCVGNGGKEAGMGAVVCGFVGFMALGAMGGLLEETPTSDPKKSASNAPRADIFGARHAMSPGRCPRCGPGVYKVTYGSNGSVVQIELCPICNGSVTIA